MWRCRTNWVVNGMNGMEKSVSRSKTVIFKGSVGMPDVHSFGMKHISTLNNPNRNMKCCKVPHCVYPFKRIADHPGVSVKNLPRTLRYFTCSTHKRYLDQSGSLSSGDDSQVHNQTTAEGPKTSGHLIAHRESQTTGVSSPLDTLPLDLTQHKKEDLFAALKEMSLDDLLTLVARSHTSMDALCFALCMKNVYRNYLELTEQDREGVAEHLKNNMSFQILVASVCAKAPHYSSQILYDLVKFFYQFGYSSQDFPLKVVLQLVRFGVGDLTLDQLISLGSFVHTLPSTRETVLLIEGIKCLINHGRDKLQSLTVGEKVLLLDIFTETLDKEVTEDLLSSLLDCLEEFEVTHAVIVISALGRLAYRCKYKKEMLFECVSLISEQFEDLTVDEVLEALEAVEVFERKVPEDYRDLLLRVAGRLQNVQDISLEDKLDIVNKLWNESLLDVDFVNSVINVISNNQTDGDSSEVTAEHITALLQSVTELPVEFQIVQQVHRSVFMEWLRKNRHLLTLRGVECLKQLMAGKEQSVPSWVLEEEDRLDSECLGSSVTTLDKNRTLYVEELSLQADKRDVLEFFKGHTEVTGVEMLSGSAFVEFKNLSDSIWELKNEMILDSRIQLKSLDEVKDLPEPYDHMFVSEEDYKDKPRSDWPTVRSLTENILGRVRERGKLVGYSTNTDITDHQGQVSLGLDCTDLVLTHDGNPDNRVGVVIVKPGKYFHNTGHLKQSYYTSINKLQENGYKLLVIYVEEVSHLCAGDGLCKWLDERLEKIDNYQTPQTWSTNVEYK